MVRQRRWEECDLACVAAAATDSRIPSGTTSRPCSPRRRGRRSSIGRWGRQSDDEGLSLAIEEKATSTAVGLITLLFRPEPLVAGVGTGSSGEERADSPREPSRCCRRGRLARHRYVALRPSSTRRIFASLLASSSNPCTGFVGPGPRAGWRGHVVLGEGSCRELVGERATRSAWSSPRADSYRAKEARLAGGGGEVVDLGKAGGRQNCTGEPGHRPPPRRSTLATRKRRADGVHAGMRHEHYGYAPSAIRTPELGSATCSAQKDRPQIDGAVDSKLDEHPRLKGLRRWSGPGNAIHPIST